MIIGEQSLDQYKAKWLADRTFNVKCRPGIPEYSIKEVIDHHSSTDSIRRGLYDEVIDFRKNMMCFRLIHYNDAFTENTCGLRNRDKELCAPLLRLFQGAKVQAEISEALTIFLTEKKERKANSLEGAIYPLIVNLIAQLQGAYEIPVNSIWNSITTNIDGVFDDRKPDEFKTFEYGILYKNTVTKIIVDKFCSLRGRQDKIKRFAKSYVKSINIEIKNVSSVGSVGSEGCVCTAIEVYRTIIEKHEIQLFDKSPNTILRSICDIPNDHRIMTIVNGNGNSHLGPAVTSSSHLDNENMIENKIKDANSTLTYRIGKTDIFACPNCKQRGDKWYMHQHICGRDN